MTGPTTQERILSVVQSIPAGRVTTYGAIADQVEGASARSVGRALKADGHDAPWWRVVNAAGRPAPGVEDVARERYAQEHTPLTAHPNSTYSVDLAKAFWPDASSPQAMKESGRRQQRAMSRKVNR
jgi:methylated-DNA-protein-cysteine methyltransferase related protein